MSRARKVLDLTEVKIDYGVVDKFFNTAGDSLQVEGLAAYIIKKHSKPSAVEVFTRLLSYIKKG